MKFDTWKVMEVTGTICTIAGAVLKAAVSKHSTNETISKEVQRQFEDYIKATTNEV